MSGFAVGLGRRGQPPDRRTQRAVAEGFAPWPKPGSRSSGPVVMLSSGWPSSGPGARGGAVPLACGDARLDPPTASLEQAWRERGEGWVLGLRGEFSCALWLKGEGRLDAVRDPLGIKPLYFALAAGELWLSNLPGALLTLPGLDSSLDDTAVLDHLLFDRCREPEATVWKGIRRVPPGHRLTWTSGDSLAVEKWAGEPLALAPSGSPGRRLEAEEVAEELRRLLDAAVARRLPEHGRVSIWMSGGLDSTAVAASVAACGGRGVAHTVTYDRLIADREGDLAHRAARHLAMPHRAHALDDDPLYRGWRELPPSPLPDDPASDAAYREIDERALEHSETALTGFGGDPLLLPDRDWWRGGGPAWWKPALFVRSWLETGSRPPLGLAGARARARLARRWRDGFPPWLAKDFAARTGALERYRDLTLPAARRDSPRGDRREAMEQSYDAGWADLFEKLDAGSRLVPIRRFHPFFDADLMGFLLSLPSLPWCLEKRALRLAMAPRLPRAIVHRPKTPLAGEPWPGLQADLEALWGQWREAAPEVDGFIDFQALRAAWRAAGSAARGHAAVEQALAFACWLGRARRGRLAQGP
ncbi:MAG: asparagine synthase-related protein [Acidobacteriota bacterium]